jgi:anti-sigma regulatory factor (Ser/Thr protein kinase)
MSSRTTHTFRHDALVYDDDHQLVGRVVPYLEGAIHEGVPAVAVLNRRNWRVLREALGPNAAQVSYTDCDDFYVHPVRAVAAYDATLRAHAAAGSPGARVVGELPFGPTEREWNSWAGYEAILNRALAHHHVSVLCTYDSRVLPDRLVEVAYRTHPHVHADRDGDGPAFEEPGGFVAEHAPHVADVPGLPDLGRCPNVEAFRERLGAALSRAGVSPARAMDMILAASEVFENAARHGGGSTSMRAGTVEGWFVCEVSDEGPGLDDPLAGYLPPTNDRPHAGLWVARQLVSRLELLPPGLTVRLWL